MRAHVYGGHSQSLVSRQGHLKRLEELLLELEVPAQAALAADLGKPAVEAFFEVVGVQGELKLAKKQLKRWMAPRRVALPAVQQPGRTWVQDEPLGTVLILGPWNYPLMLVLRPLVSALAAGNTVVLKPARVTPLTALKFAELVALA